MFIVDSEADPIEDTRGDFSLLIPCSHIKIGQEGNSFNARPLIDCAAFIEIDSEYHLTMRTYLEHSDYGRISRPVGKLLPEGENVFHMVCDNPNIKVARVISSIVSRTIELYRITLPNVGEMVKLLKHIPSKYSYLLENAVMSVPYVIETEEMENKIKHCYDNNYEVYTSSFFDNSETSYQYYAPNHAIEELKYVASAARAMGRTETYCIGSTLTTNVSIMDLIVLYNIELVNWRMIHGIPNYDLATFEELYCK